GRHRRGAGEDYRRRAGAAATASARARAARPRPARCQLRAAGGARRGDRRSTRRPKGAARPSAHRPGRARRRSARASARGERGRRMRVVLAVDGGNSKTDLALVAEDGRALALRRGPRSTPQYLGVDGCLDVLERLLDEALDESGLERGNGPVAEIGELL